MNKNKNSQKDIVLKIIRNSMWNNINRVEATMESLKENELESLYGSLSKTHNEIIAELEIKRIEYNKAIEWIESL